MTRPNNPVLIAFGLRALAHAMRAKLGPLTRAEGEDLMRCAAETGRADIFHAASEFVARVTPMTELCEVAQLRHDAAEDLLDRLAGLDPDLAFCPAAAEVVDAALAATVHSWQRRADLA